MKKRAPGQMEFGLLYGGIVLVALSMFRSFPSLTDVTPSCVFKDLTGIPCPTCGSTRAAMHLAHGAVITSLRLNPLVSIALAVSLVYFLYSAVTFLGNLPRVHLSFSERETGRIRMFLILAAMINWGYLILVR